MPFFLSCQCWNYVIKNKSNLEINEVVFKENIMTMLIQFFF